MEEKLAHLATYTYVTGCRVITGI